MQRILAVPTFALAAAAALAAPALAQGSTTPLTTERILTGLSRPVWVGAPPGETDRLFILEQHTGLVRVAKLGPTGWTLEATPFLNTAGKSHTSGNERGLLSLAFHPNYQENGLFFVYYTSPLAGVGSRIERYTASPPSSDVANPGSAKTILEQAQPFSNHNGGSLNFGPDGYLYFAFGDGGSAGDPACNAQQLTTWLGKMLRIDVDNGDPYRIPPDNPFLGTAGALPEIYDLGLRNPWRWTFDSETGDRYVADVGQNVIEEVNWVPAGSGGHNFGWKIMEGDNCFSTSACPAGVPACNDPSFTDPVHTYTHAAGGCSVTGGFVYRGCAIPDLRGTYFFADYCSSNIWSFVISGGAVTQFQNRSAELAPGGGLSIGLITSFGEDGNGEILIVDQGSGTSGEIYRIVAAATPSGFADCDQNGQDDACEIAENPVKDLDGNGELDVCQSFSADVGAISVSAGGTQTLSLHPGAAKAGDLYLVAGSTTGTCCIAVGSAVVPLTFDAYTEHFITFANQPPLVQTFGFLDGAGEATAQIDAPPGVVPASLVGLTAFHAYGLVNLPSAAIDFGSNFVTLDFLP